MKGSFESNYNTCDSDDLIVNESNDFIIIEENEYDLNE